MNDADEQLLTARLRRELRGLPDLTAPKTLAPRVMAALAARQARAWYQASWSYWPASMRVLFLLVGGAVLAGLAFAGFQLPQYLGLAGAAGNSLADSLTWLRPYLENMARLGDTVFMVAKALPQQLLWSLAAMVALAYALCVGLGTVGYRLALNRI